MLKRQSYRTRGQSLVEFALSSIVLFLLLAAAVDIGRIFLTYQTMINAVKEGLSYGVYRPLLPNIGNPSQPNTNDVNIRYRARYSNSNQTTNAPSVPFVNLLDLNSNGIDDDTEAGVLDTYIVIDTYPDDDPNGACQYRERNCWMRITMLYDYQPIFPLAPIFGNGVQLRLVREQQIIRSSNADAMPTTVPPPTSTSAPAPTSTSAPAPTSTSAPAPTSTSAPAPTSTSAPAPTSTPTNTSAPTSTPTRTPTPTNTPTSTSTSTSTPTRTATPTSTPTSTPTRTATPTPVSNIMVNPGFESGSGGWTKYSSGGNPIIDSWAPHTGSYSADLCDYDNCTDYVQQQITVPSNGTLTYWWYMTSSEGTGTAYDYLRVRLYSTSGTLLATLRTWSNTSTRNTWSQDTISLAAYAGQTVMLRFESTTDGSAPTDFFVDDVSVK